MRIITAASPLRLGRGRHNFGGETEGHLHVPARHISSSVQSRGTVYLRVKPLLSSEGTNQPTLLLHIRLYKYCHLQSGYDVLNRKIHAPRAHPEKEIFEVNFPSRVPYNVVSISSTVLEKWSSLSSSAIFYRKIETWRKENPTKKALIADTSYNHDEQNCGNWCVTRATGFLAARKGLKRTSRTLNQEWTTSKPFFFLINAVVLGIAFSLPFTFWSRLWPLFLQRNTVVAVIFTAVYLFRFQQVAYQQYNLPFLSPPEPTTRQVAHMCE